MPPAERSHVFADGVLDERVILVTGGGTGLGKAAARELACASEIELQLGPAPTVRDARRALVEHCPLLGPLADRSLLAVNAEYADDARLLAAGDEVALIPPVSGG